MAGDAWRTKEGKMKASGWAVLAALGAMVFGGTAWGGAYRYPAELPKKNVELWVHKPDSAHDHLHAKIPEKLLAGVASSRAELHVRGEDGMDHVISTTFVEQKKSTEIKRTTRDIYVTGHHMQTAEERDWLVAQNTSLVLGMKLLPERTYNCYVVVYGKTESVSKEYGLMAGGTGTHKNCPDCVHLVQPAKGGAGMAGPARGAAGARAGAAGGEEGATMTVYERGAFPRLEAMGMVKPGAKVSVVAKLTPEYTHIRFATSSGKQYEGVVRTSELAEYLGGGEEEGVERTSNGVRIRGVAPGEWTHDWDAAMAEARRTGGLVFANFTGSDWCGWCQLMEKQVFSTDAWGTWARLSGVQFAWLDFPQNAALLPAPETQARNRQLSSKYGVGGYPTYLLVDADGEVVWRGGAKQGVTPEEFIGGLTHAIMVAGSRPKAAQPAAGGESQSPAAGSPAAEKNMTIYSLRAYPTRLEVLGVVKPGVKVTVVEQLSPGMTHIRFVTASGTQHEGVVRTAELEAYGGQ